MSLGFENWTNEDVSEAGAMGRYRVQSEPEPCIRHRELAVDSVHKNRFIWTFYGASLFTNRYRKCEFTNISNN